MVRRLEPVSRFELNKSGTSKLPLDRVLGLAKALEVDAKYLFRLTLEQQGNETTALAIEQIFGTI